MAESIVTHEDCMELMKRYPDKYFDLAIVDPPYGIDAGNMPLGVGKKVGVSKKEDRVWTAKDWDNYKPTEIYFDELKRVSKNQIIWGGNYFNLPPTRCFLIWDKVNYGRSFSECEMAWTSLDEVARIFKKRHDNQFGYKKIHPTQKPVALYKWLLSNYAKEGDKIFDSHLGSGSARIAAHDLGYDFIACELDKDYFEAQEKRFIDHVTRTTELKDLGYAKSELNKTNPTLF